MFSEEPVQFSFTPSEIHQLPSFFEPGLPVHSPSGLETCPGRTVYSVEELKKRRMISNRESARRSRWRKKRHLENLKSQVNRLSMENQDLKNRLCLASHQCIVAERETNRLMTESLLLQQRLSGLCQILDNMHLL